MYQIPYLKDISCKNNHAIMFLFFDRVNIVAFDFLGHGDSPKPDQPDLYTANEVSHVSALLNAMLLFCD